MTVVTTIREKVVRTLEDQSERRRERVGAYGLFGALRKKSEE